MYSPPALNDVKIAASFPATDQPGVNVLPATPPPVIVDVQPTLSSQRGTYRTCSPFVTAATPDTAAGLTQPLTTTAGATAGVPQ